MKAIQVKKEFQIPGTDIILEAGDQIHVVEGFNQDGIHSGKRPFSMFNDNEIEKFIKKLYSIAKAHPPRYVSFQHPYEIGSTTYEVWATDNAIFLLDKKGDIWFSQGKEDGDEIKIANLVNGNIFPAFDPSCLK